MTMLKTKLIHPEIMAALSLCGHGSKVLIADANRYTGAGGNSFCM